MPDVMTAPPTDATKAAAKWLLPPEIEPALLALPSPPRTTAPERQGWALPGLVLKGVLLAALLAVGVALTITGLVPVVFLTLTLLLVGLAPILIVAFAFLITEEVGLPEAGPASKVGQRG